MAKKKLPPKPEHGIFQEAYWDDDYGYWKIRDIQIPEPKPPVLTLAEKKIQKKYAIDALLSEKSQAGYKHDFGGEYGTLTLQTRRSDLSNWLAVAQVSFMMVSQEQGDEVFGSIRTAENINVIVTASEALDAMLSMQEQQKLIMEYAWNLKDFLKTINTNKDLEDFDITIGWPAP
jgi:uncharacterized radical SAM superfamily Fe-S cluster-containing enzyme